MSDQQSRQQVVAGCMDEIRGVIEAEGVNRAALDKVKAALVALGEHKELFGEADFPSPTKAQGGKLWLISEDPDETFSLYLVSTVTGTSSPPHDHTTWAVIAGLDGEEENTVYRRLDDGSVEGQGCIEVDHVVVLKDGDAIAFMPEDVHHIKAVSATPTRHLHLYGRSFDRQNGRLAFNIEAGTTKPIPTGMLPIDRTHRIQ